MKFSTHTPADEYSGVVSVINIVQSLLERTSFTVALNLPRCRTLVLWDSHSLSLHTFMFELRECMSAAVRQFHFTFFRL